MNKDNCTERFSSAKTRTRRRGISQTQSQHHVVSESLQDYLASLDPACDDTIHQTSDIQEDMAQKHLAFQKTAERRGAVTLNQQELVLMLLESKDSTVVHYQPRRANITKYAFNAPHDRVQPANTA